MADALTRWQEFAQRFSLPAEAAGGVYMELERSYGEAHRHYHTMAHIMDMLDGRDALGADGYALEAAIWFHDVVYDPRSAENELKSVEYAARALSPISDPKFHADVERLIMMTDHRERPEREDEKIICDLDLMILGRNEESYLVYTEAIRNEYAHVPDDLFYAARRGVLEAFLARSVIYQTEVMRGEFEERARGNLRREMEGIEC